jgi:hypothetical protein
LSCHTGLNPSTEVLAELKGFTKQEVTEELGRPRQTEGRYVWLEGDSHDDTSRGHTSTLVFWLDESNMVEKISFLWGNYLPPQPVAMEFKAWKSADREAREAMRAGLVEGWRQGLYRDQLKGVDEVLEVFPESYFVDFWMYPVGCFGGCGVPRGAIRIDFDPGGRVARVVSGHMD